jgi:hypothetical protein
LYKRCIIGFSSWFSMSNFVLFDSIMNNLSTSLHSLHSCKMFMFFFFINKIKKCWVQVV